MSGSHPRCIDGHVCQQPSGRVCIEKGCKQPAGTSWGPMWCPEHDKERLDRISDSLESIATRSHTRRRTTAIRAKCEHQWVVDGDEVEYCTHCGVSPD